MGPGFAVRPVGGVELLVCDALEERGVVHGFTTRSNGFGRRDAADRDRRRLQASLNLARLAMMRQEHGRTVRAHESCGSDPLADGLVTGEPRAGVVVQSADCVPLLFWAERANAVAAVHAGWRGTLLGIAREAAASLRDTFGCAPEELCVALGPAIRVCCFEVGDEVVEAFAASGRNVEAMSRMGSRGRRHLDLVEDNRRQLLEQGVPAARIHDSGVCTVCHNDRFYSYRKEGAGVGRILGVIAPRP